MSFVMTDGFDHHSRYAGTGSAAYTEAGLRWDTPPNVVTGPGRYGTGNYATGSADLIRQFFTTEPARTVGFAFKAPSSLGGTYSVLQLLDKATPTIQAEVRLNPSGTMSILANNALQATSTQVLTAGSWVYIEFYSVITTAASGTLKLYVNGTLWTSATNIRTATTANSYANMIKFLCYSSSLAYDDIYVYDQAEKTFADISILTDPPVMDSASSGRNQWAVNSGAFHFDAVNDTDWDGDSTYVSTASPTLTEMFRFPDRSGSITGSSSIVAIGTSFIARKDDTTTRQIRDACFSNNNLSATDPSYPLFQGYIYYQTYREKNPITNANWGPSDVGGSGAEFGFQSSAV